MPEDENITEGPEQEEASEAEEIDIEIEPSAPTGGSRGVWFVIVLIIILAALAWYALWAKKQAEQRELQEKQVRTQQYQMQEHQIGEQLNKATQMLDANDLAGAMEVLKGATTRLSSLATQAASNEDTAQATRIHTKMNKAKSAVAEIEEKQDELVELARGKVLAIQKQLGVSPPPKKEAEEAPKEEETTEAKEPEQVKEMPVKPAPEEPRRAIPR